MRRNRKVSRKQSVIGMHTMHLGIILLTLLMAVITNQLATASCDSLMNKIGAKTRTLKEKKAELCRVSAKWEQAKSKDGLQKALDNLCIEMSPASPDYVVRVDSDGNVDMRARSVRLVRNRMRKRMENLASIGSLPSSSGRRTLRR